ncbi:MAG: O-antigen ligase family protein [Planctomycetes bacterium]|nr:O-antigen ligase family protein [Planctomycetota bacterium]
MIIIFRQVVIYIFVAIILVYAWKDWFKGLCGMILLTAIMGRYDFPQSIGGIQGLNIFNILLGNICLAWLTHRKHQGLSWDMPTIINVFLLLWLGVILVGWMRMVLDRSNMVNLFFQPFPLKNLISEQLINTIKWPITGLLLFDGCRTYRHIKLALATILLLFALFAVQIIKYVPPRVVFEPGRLNARQNIKEDVGISINGAAKMLSGVPWAMLTIIPLLNKRKYIFYMFGACMISLFALGLAGSRSGFIACGATLLILCCLRWRRYLLLLPLFVFLMYVMFPGASERMLSGFGDTDNISGETTTNQYKVTSGRNEIWPFVIDKIYESPIIGFGREAHVRTGLRFTLREEVSRYEAVAHPHQAYLEVLLDNGLIGFIIIVGLHAILWLYSARLFVDRGDPIYTAGGGVALALLTGHLVAYMGGQSFYPEEIDIGIWCAIGVMCRLYVIRRRLMAEGNWNLSNQHTQRPGTLLEHKNLYFGLTHD